MGEHRHAKIIRELLRNRLERGRCAEIGVWSGRTADILLGSLQSLKTYYAIDPYLAYPDYLSQAHDNLGECPQAYLNDMYRRTWSRLTRKYGKRLIFLRHETSVVSGATMIPRESLDLVFIDGNHSPPYVEFDVTAAELWVRQGGIICGHDWGRVHRTVRLALKQLGYSDIDDHKHNTWWVEKVRSASCHATSNQS